MKLKDGLLMRLKQLVVTALEVFWLAMVTLHLTPYYRGIRYHTDTLPGSRKLLVC